MCGIGALIYHDRDWLSDRLHALNAAQSHRGPDDVGAWISDIGSNSFVGLSHRRLAIIDPGPDGHQPMVDETGNAISFNGEIYNYKDLRSELIAKGATFQTNSDTEVILQGYRHYGLKNLLSRLRGMFAFALWDSKQGELVLARDPNGIKPLYYTISEEGFACASEAHALVKCGVARNELSESALDSFLAYGSVQPPLTIFSSITALLPGHHLIITANGKASTPRSYWPEQDVNEDQQRIDLGLALEQAVRRHLVADVPIAFFLSGGYDSTAIAVIASRMCSQPISTFTLTFPQDPTFSEENAARKISDRIGSRHFEIPITQTDVEHCISNYFQAMDQPSDDGLNTYLLSNAVARAGFKTSIHGVGGDELFGGYPSFYLPQKLALIKSIPAPLRRLFAKLTDASKISQSKIAEVLRSDGTLIEAFLARRRLFSYEERRKLLGKEPPLGTLGMPWPWLQWASDRTQAARDSFSVISHLELMNYAGSKLLPDGDVMSMNNSLEVRFPFLDIDLENTALSLPEAAKRLGRNGEKFGLTSSINSFPHDLMTKGKSGFTVPIQSWLEKGLSKELHKREYSGLDGLLDHQSVKQIDKKYELSEESAGWIRRWALITLDQWTESHA